MRRSVETVKMIAWTVLVALSLHSCCKHHKQTVQEDAIKMGVLSTNVSTRAVIDSLPNLITASYGDGTNKVGFGVYAYKYNTGTTDANLTRIFNNEEVTPASNLSTTSWTYVHTRYWDSNPTVTYQFMAYWPYGQSTAGQNHEYYVTENNRTVTLHNIKNWQEEAVATDYLIATRYNRYNSGGGFKEQNGYVDFTFYHALSRLSIKAFYVGSEADTITVNSLGLSGNNNVLEDGYSDLQIDFSDPGNRIGPANSTPHLANSTTIFSRVLGIPKRSYVDETSQDTIYTPIGSWLMVPHVWRNINLTIGYKIGGSSYKNSSPIPLTLGKSSDSWRIIDGKTYILTLKFNSAGESIEVESIVVSDWIEGRPYTREVYNW